MLIGDFKMGAGVGSISVLVLKEPDLFSVTVLALILENLGSLSNKFNCRLIQKRIKSLDPCSKYL